MSDRWRRADVDGVRTLAGVGDQTDTCVNGTVDCPGPGAGRDQLPCAACFLTGGERA